MADQSDADPTKLSDLKHKGLLVESLWHAVDHCSINSIPKIVREIIRSGAWQKRHYRNHTYEHDRFLDFIITPPHAGCGWKPELVEGLLQKAGDDEVLVMWREHTVGKQGAHSSNRTMKPVRGTTRAYTLDRLKRERPDLFDKVTAKEMSANAAAIEAGFRKQTTPLEKILKLLSKLTPTERRQLRARLDEMRKPKAA